MFKLQMLGRIINDAPSLSVVDNSNRGRGALLSCTVNQGRIESVIGRKYWN